jgi:hypothetical protein
VAEESKGNVWLWVIAAAAGGYALFSYKKAQAAAGNDPNNPPPAASPNTSRVDLAQSWANWIVNTTKQYGYSLSADTGATDPNFMRQIVRNSDGSYMYLVNKNQTVTDANINFWRLFDRIFVTHTADINDDNTWNQLQALHLTLVNGFTPAFFA